MDETDLKQYLARPRLVVVEDSKLVCQMIKHHLDKDFEVIEFSTCEEGIEYLASNSADLLVLDYLLPGKNGLDLLRELRLDSVMRDIPVLFMTACQDEVLVREAFKWGADDFIRKPFNLVEFDARLNHLLRKRNWTEGLEQTVLKLKDTSEKDELTGTLNRHALSVLGVELLRKAAKERAPLSLMILDMDDFKEINDTHGHQAGDSVLRQFGELIRTLLRESDFVFRYGGDEFILMLPNTNENQVREVRNKIISTLRGFRFTHESLSLKLSTSIGTSTFTRSQCGDESDLNDLIASADKVLYEAKGENKKIVET